jgi:outer membrane biosynthesis protein TonB
MVYVLLWSSSVVVSVTLIVLMRTRWGQTRPLHKCAALSLLVHLLLACVAMTVRIVAGGSGGGGEGPPIRVRIVADTGSAPTLVDDSSEAPAAIAPPLLEPPPEEAKATATEAVQQSDEQPDAEPPATELVDAEPKKEDPPPQTPAEVQVPDEPAKIADNSDAAPPAPSQPNVDENREQKAPTPTNTSDTDSQSAAAGTAVTQQPPSISAPPTTSSTPYSLRTGPGRLGLVEQQGGSGQTEAAVAAALRWLAAAQSRDGRWDADEFGAGQEQMVLGQNRGGAGRGADTGVSALALLAFMGAGYSHQHGEYQETVRSGLDFLLRSQAADGSLFGDATLYAQMYCHSMATFALAEAQAMTGDRRLEPAVTKAVHFCLAAQHPASGGWRYRPGDSGDTSQLGWQLMALASARQAGIHVPAQTWTLIDRFLQSVRRGNYGGLASYRPDSPASTSMTAEALYCRLLLGELVGERIDESAAQEASAQLLAELPDAGRINLYYWYYATLALHHRHPRDEHSAADWNAWNDALTATLVSTQVSSGKGAGSWETNTLWGGYGGRVYTTAMAAMCLEVYYRYAPAPRRDRWTATRPSGEPASH